jgi:hypothetical protein
MEPYTATEAAAVILSLTAYVMVTTLLFKQVRKVKPEWGIKAELTAGALGLAVFLMVMYLFVEAGI